MIINLPQWAMGISEGTITEWKVKEGDSVSKNQVLCIIDENKVTDNFESPVCGIVKKIYVAEGDSVDCGEPLIDIE